MSTEPAGEPLDLDAIEAALSDLQCMISEPGWRECIEIVVGSAPALVAAVRAVLALHQPTAILTDRDGTEHVICGGCRMVSCPTVAAVGAVGGQE